MEIANRMTSPLIVIAYSLLSPSFWHGRVEERADHREQPIDAVHEPTARGAEVRRAREHSELGLRQTCQIPHYAAPEQPKHLYCVLETDGIGIPDDEQGGGL